MKMIDKYYTTHNYTFPKNNSCSFTVYLFHDIKNSPLERVDIAYALIDSRTLNGDKNIPDIGFITDQLHLAAPKSKENKLIINGDEVRMRASDNGVNIEYFGEKCERSLKSVLGL
jgi:hypothetical protein